MKVDPKSIAAVFAALVLSVPLAGTAQARAHRHHVAIADNGGHQRHIFYGVGNGGETPRTTATGGNPGGYSNRN